MKVRRRRPVLRTGQRVRDAGGCGHYGVLVFIRMVSWLESHGVKVITGTYCRQRRERVLRYQTSNRKVLSPAERGARRRSGGYLAMAEGRHAAQGIPTVGAK